MHVEHWDDIGFTMRLTKAESHYAEFELFEGCLQRDGTRLYPKKHKVSYEPTKSLDEAERIVSGMVKWDGCSHFYFSPDDEDNEGYVHACGQGFAENLAAALVKVIPACLAHVEGADLECAGVTPRAVPT